MTDPAHINSEPRYVGRFAPSPTGPLHLGSLVAAMASWLDARAHGGSWLLRIEDIDPPREVPGASAGIVETLAAFGFEWDGEPLYQSTRQAAYQSAFDELDRAGWVYPCACSRREIADSMPAASSASQIYPGTCRYGLPPGRAARAWRMRIDRPLEPRSEGRKERGNASATQPASIVEFHDLGFGRQRQNLATDTGDFVLKRADGPWAYQLAVVVDDAAQGVTDVVRGADLLDSTPRQIHLQRALGFATPRYRHVPVVIAADGSGEKLSKQTGAQPLDRSRPLTELRLAARHLDLPEPRAATVADFWDEATRLWKCRLKGIALRFSTTR